MAQANAKLPNILVIWGDDVGMWNISAYHRGMMGGSTPNIDRIAKEGMIFMDHYAEASCTGCTGRSVCRCSGSCRRLPTTHPDNAVSTCPSMS